MKGKSSRSIIDEPLFKEGEESEVDGLDLGAYYDGLADFIRNSDTPITIGIQGQWGSGKSTLMNKLWWRLEDTSEEEIIRTQIWVNSWEHSLMSSPEETLANIVNHIVAEISQETRAPGQDNPNGEDASAKEKREKREKIKSAAKTATAAMFRVLMGKLGNQEGGLVAREAMEGWLGKDDYDAEKESLHKSPVEQLREALQKGMAGQDSAIRQFVIYIDDLDRLEPKTSVHILELLKNIFSLKCCVFVLAIDYEIVVKGLQDRYGDKLDQNEQEYRKFFDKIIQLPFTMPLGRFSIDSYVINLLTKIRYIEETDFDQKKEEINKILDSTIGANPRSIKRMVNSLSLIERVTPETDSENSEKRRDKLLLFGFVCCQLEFPKIYEYLTKDPDYKNWDEAFAAEITNKNEENNREFTVAFDAVKGSKSPIWDEPWEQALFRICFNSIELRSSANNISKFLNIFSRHSVEKIVDVLEQTAVTSVTRNLSLTESGKFKRTMYGGIAEWEAQQFKKYAGKSIPVALKQSVDVVKFLHYQVTAMFSENPNFVMKYGKTSGCTGYATSGKNKKFIAIYTLKGGAVVRVLKDINHDYKIPNIPGFDTDHPRKYNPEKLSTAGFNEQFCIKGSMEDFKQGMAMLEPFIKRSFEIANQYEDKILKVYGRGNMPTDEQEKKKIIELQVKRFAPDYRYNP